MILTLKLTRDENISYYNQNEIKIDIEEYLKGVVPAEIGNATLNACKAQAVVARTFAWYKQITRGYITDSSSTDQAFKVSRLISGSYANAHKAVKDTNGEVLYYQNEIITNAHYSASNGGRTVSSEERWGGKGKPYLISRNDPWDYALSKGQKNGHGVGMSQLGAKYAGSIGVDYKDILSFYFPGTEIYKEGINMATLTNTDFVKFLKSMVGQPYWYGTCVYKCTKDLAQRKAKQFPEHYTSDRNSRYTSDINKKSVCADCVGLGKGYVWTNGGEGVIESIGTDKTFNNSSNGKCPDRSANGMLDYAKSNGFKYGSISTLPEIPGVCLHKDGHVGFYIGNGEAIEAKGFQYGIVKSKVAGRGWTSWFYFPGIVYTVSAGTGSTTATSSESANTDYEFGSRTLQFGCAGTDVKELQERLTALGYSLSLYGVNGKFSSEVQEQVKKFQNANDLIADGIVGEKTFAKLKDTKAPSSYPLIKKGDRNEYVSILQEKLNKIGAGLKVSGIFDGATYLAVRQAQSKKNLKVDGIVGPDTWRILENV